MTGDVTDCVECGEEMEPGGVEEDMPMRALDMECSGCGYTAVFGQCFYPDERFTVIGPPDGASCERCENDAIHRTQQVGFPVKSYCRDHCPGHYRVTYEWAEDELDG